MDLGIIVETNDPEKVWNGFRLANTAIEDGHSVETFLLGDGVEAPDLEHPKLNPHGAIRKYTLNDGELLACGTCMDSRDLEADELRPRGSIKGNSASTPTHRGRGVKRVTPCSNPNN
ncbi:DsrE family protein [Halapricum desulfuricans]|uniref:DsrE family protein n=1 Tax=Halapricum desulfuricans TaxID=2841257 RepID=A0A897NQN2_9EURY|nr:DsrE family protein [Halapricum desulfuricans]QSG14551.1 Uncharacterized protein HSEST_1016 [Halapricum desulfuricans]